MKFKVDENLPLIVADRLQQAGYDASTVVDQQMEGAADAELARVCREEQRVLVSLDLDFADIRTYPPHEMPGLLVFRLTLQDKLHVMEVLERLLLALDEEPIEQALWIVEDRRIRIRQ